MRCLLRRSSSAQSRAHSSEILLRSKHVRKLASTVPVRRFHRLLEPMTQTQNTSWSRPRSSVQTPPRRHDGCIRRLTRANRRQNHRPSGRGPDHCARRENDGSPFPTTRSTFVGISVLQAVPRRCNRSFERGFASRWACIRRAAIMGCFAASQLDDLHVGGAGEHSEGPFRCTLFARSPPPAASPLVAACFAAYTSNP